MIDATAIAEQFAHECKYSGWTYHATSGSCVVRIVRRSAPGCLEGFTFAESVYPYLLSLLPTTSAGSTWGTDSSGCGAIGALRDGVFVMNKSGCSKRVTKALAQRLAADAALTA